MEGIWRFLVCSILIIFCCTSDCHSASLLERRYMSPTTSESSTEELSNAEPPLEELASELFQELTDDKPRLGPFTKLPALQGSAPFGDTPRYRNKDTAAAALSSFLDQRQLPFKGQFQEAPPFRTEWASERMRTGNYANVAPATQQTGSDNAIWTLFTSRYAQKQGDEPMTTQDAKEFQTVKRSPACLRKCIAQGFLHPAQCHSLC